MVQKIVTIIGCGQMGSRHLQAIAKLGCDLKVQVVEPNKNSQIIGMARLKEVLSEITKVKVEWYDALDFIDNDVDLSIIATPAKGRAEILKSLLEKGHKRFLIEKMVCQSKDEYDRILNDFQSHHAKGWVNCTRRYFPFYRDVIESMKGDGKIIFNVIAGNHGLGCNSIHFLDLFSALCGGYNQIEINGEYLLPNLIANRRGEDYVEFAGTLIARTDNGDVITVTFDQQNDAAPVVNILSQNSVVYVDESSGDSFIKKRTSQWNTEKCEFKTMYTSEATMLIAESILLNDTCLLPTIEESFKLHGGLFHVFNEHMKRVTGSRPALCPIT